MQVAKPNSSKGRTGGTEHNAAGQPVAGKARRPTLIEDAGTSARSSSPGSSEAPKASSPGRAEGQTVWLSKKQAATRAGISTRTVNRWLELKYLSSIRLPSPKGLGPIRIRLGDLEALMAQGSLS